jgi:hypothetical protein
VAQNLVGTDAGGTAQVDGVDGNSKGGQCDSACWPAISISASSCCRRVLANRLAALLAHPA